jgi:hypothetical protein
LHCIHNLASLLTVSSAAGDPDAGHGIQVFQMHQVASRTSNTVPFFYWLSGVVMCMFKIFMGSFGFSPSKPHQSWRDEVFGVGTGHLWFAHELARNTLSQGGLGLVSQLFGVNPNETKSHGGANFFGRANFGKLTLYVYGCGMYELIAF